MTHHARRQPRRSRTTLAAVVVVAVTALSAGAALGTGLPWLGDEGVVVSEPSPSPTPSPTPTPTPTPTPPEDAVFTLVAAGDVLNHVSVNQSARTGSGYDFVPLLAPVDPFIAGADLALCHLEVPVAPAGVAPSGFPLFGAPSEIVPALAANGWDGCSTASNHSVDRGAAGVTATLDALDAAGLGHVGTARTAEEAAAPQIYQLEREGQTIRVAQIAASYGTNGLPVPAGSPWMVTLIDTAALVAQATAARQAGADIVVASIHCCVEYVTEPTTRQAQIATELGASGVIDLLIGHHAHVPQPIAKVPGGPQGDGMWVAYGLGNFISNQGTQAGLSARTENGLLLTATFTKPMDGPAVVTSVDWTAITVDRRAGHRVEPLSTLAATGAGTGTLTPAEILARHGLVAEAAGTAAPERSTPPEPTGPPPFVVPRGWTP